MEGKPAKVLGRPAKTDVRSYVLGASPMPSSIIIYRLRTTVSLLVSKTSDSGSNPLACANKNKIVDKTKILCYNRYVMYRHQD